MHGSPKGLNFTDRKGDSEDGDTQNESVVIDLWVR